MKKYGGGRKGKGEGEKGGKRGRGNGRKGGEEGGRKGEREEGRNIFSLTDGCFGNSNLNPLNLE